MPTYIYECKKCGKRFELTQKISDTVIKVHEAENCGGEVFRVIQPVGVIFKGTGWTVKRNNSMKKIDQAINKLGIEQENDWSTKED